MAAWPTQRSLRFAFAATGLAAAAGYWLTMPVYSTSFLLMIVIGSAAVVSTAALVVALVSSIRGEATPEIVIIALLYGGGLAMLIAIVKPAPTAFPWGLAAFAAGSACLGWGKKAAAVPKKRRAEP